jgi:5-methylcytosine-specific restriction endonuclease McrA
MNLQKNPRIKLSPTKWKQLVRYVYDRDQFCVFCGRHDQSTPAHIVRRSQGGNDAPNNVIRACVGCHSSFDQYKIELPEYVVEMLKKEPINL